MPSCQWIFGPFRLDPDRACLWREAQAMALPPKLLAVLSYLVTHPDRLVTKEELLNAAWPETAVSDAVVRVAIGTLRKMLSDTSQTPQYIATVPRHGYRFVAPVAEHHATEPAPAAPELSIAPPSLSQPSRVALPAVAERRHLTVLCCDLVDATTLIERLDPEDLREMARAYYQTCAAVIQQFDGSLVQCYGDSVLAYFGYPVAHEDDAQRAVWTGLGILEAMDTLTTRLTLLSGERLSVRLGVHTGLVVVGDTGIGTRHEPLVLGETPDIAGRLQHLAEPNALVISAATYQLIEGYFTCAVLGAQSLPRRGQPLQAYRVLGPSGLQSRLEVAATRGFTPLVGRALEVELLRERWMRVKAGMGQVVVMEGEAGIGKSRLVQVLKDHVASELSTSVECRGAPYYQHTALYPITELLQRWLQWRPGEAPEIALGKIEALLTQAGLALNEAVSLIAELLALPLPAERYAPRSLAPEQQRQRTLDVLLTLVAALAERQPVLVIVEDLHWMDASTLELLELLIDQVPTARIYAVLTCRPTFQPAWGFRTHITPLALNRLTPLQATEMIGRIPQGQHLPAAVVEQIVARTDGIPLFVEEVTKAVVEAGGYAHGPRSPVAAEPALALAIPATLQDALLARLDRLGSAKGVAQMGATLGRQFSYALLRAISALEDESLQRALAALVEAELLYQRGQHRQAVYTFKHALVQEAAYESVLQRVRRQAHQHIVQVLETQFPETVTSAPELLAHHARRGELWDSALVYLRQAGEQAVARSAYREAVAAFEQALDVIQHLPESRDTLAQAIDLRLALHSALYLLGELGRVFINLQHAHALAETLGDPHRLGWVAAYLLAHFAAACEPGQALVFGERALAIAADLGDVGLTVTSHIWLGSLYRSLGDYRRSADFYQKNVASLHGMLLYEHLGLPGIASATSRSHLVASLAECGAFTAGKARAEEGVQIAEAADHPYSRVVAYWAVGFQALRQGDILPAMSILECALSLSQEAYMRLLIPMVASTLGAAYTLAGRSADSLRFLEQAIELGMAIRFLLYHGLRVVWLGEAYLLGGRLDEAYTQAQQALEFSRVHQERGHEAYALRLLGEVVAQGTPSETAQAKAHYQQALTLAEELGMRPLQAHCQLGLGRLYARADERVQAHTALGAAITLYRSMDMVFWLPQAEAILEQVAVRSAGDSPY